MTVVRSSSVTINNWYQLWPIHFYDNERDST